MPYRESRRLARRFTDISDVLHHPVTLNARFNVFMCGQRPPGGEPQPRAGEQRVVRLRLERHIGRHRKAQHKRLVVAGQRLRDSGAARFPPHPGRPARTRQVLQIDAHEPHQATVSLGSQHAFELVVGPLFDTHDESRLLEIPQRLGLGELDAAKQPELFDA